MEITVVEKENQQSFRPLMPDFLWNEADLVIGAIEEGTACGILALKKSGTTFTLTYLFVAEGYRRKGVATALLRQMHGLARMSGIDVALVQFSSGSDTAEIENCLEKNRFERDEISNPIYVTTLGDVTAKLLRAKAGTYAQVIPLSEVTASLWNRLVEALKKLPDKDGTVPDLEPRSYYDRDTSFLLERKGEPAGCILVDRREDSFILSYFCVFGNAAPKELMALFSASYSAAKRQCADETKIYINTLTETAEKMVLAMTNQKAAMIGEAVTWYCLY